MSTPLKSKNLLRRPFVIALLVIFAWFGIGGGLGPLFGKLSTVQENDNANFLPSNAEATMAAKDIEKFSTAESRALPTLILYLGQIDQSKLGALNADLATIGAKNIEGTTVPISKYLLPDQPVFAYPSQDGKAMLASIPVMADAAAQLLPNNKPVLPEIIATLRTEASGFAKANSLEAKVTGIGAILGDLFGAFGAIDTALLGTTLLVVSIILIIVYRSPVLWILPLLSALFALSTAGGVIYLLAKNDVIALNGQSQGILSVLVLGAATDYALLLISRYREELHHHESRFDAMKSAYKGIFEPILASGTTVMLSLLVLLASELSSNRGLGPVGAIGIAASMVTILTLLPALLVAFGRWIFWPRIPRFDDVDAQLTGTWAKVGNIVDRRPRRVWISTAVLLVVLAGFSTSLNTKGVATSESFTTEQDSVVGLDLLTQHFPGGSGQPTQIVTTEAKAQAVIAAVKKAQYVSEVDYTRVSPTIPGAPLSAVKVVDGKVIVNATLSVSPDSREAIGAIPEIRKVVHVADSEALVGGSTAVSYDIAQASSRDNRVIIPIVLILITIILGVLLRSILSALLLLITVVLSYLATLGACKIVFDNIFHFKGADQSFPLFAFIFLVALGIDYNIFLMTRVREESIKIGTRAGVIKGLTVTGSVITSAGVVLAATFAVLGVIPLVFLAELGFAVAFGVLLDTIVVRSLLVPALVREIGGKVWWPSKLQDK